MYNRKVKYGLRGEVLIVAECNVNNFQDSKLNFARIVLIVAECNVNVMLFLYY